MSTAVSRDRMITKELLAKRRKQIETLALKRFLASSERKQPVFQKNRMLLSRKAALKNYDSIAMERILGKSDLFPIAYLQTGLTAGQAVCRISIRDTRGSVIGYGTGFLVSSGIIMTNNHVLPSQGVALTSVAEFNYQDDENFMPCPTYNFRLDPESLFITDKELDFTLVGIKENASLKKDIGAFGFLKLNPGTAGITEGEYVSIIQHPKGGPKAVTLRENKVSDMKEAFIHYLTDTEPGSSGSPVFNDQWELVALHHSGVPHPEKKNEWIANEGIRISAIVTFLTEKYAAFSPGEQKLIRSILPDVQFPDSSGDNNSGDSESGKKREEEERDGGNAGKKGYDALFLGKKYKVPLPSLSEAMEKDTARMKNGGYVLDYVHFSVVMKRSRGLAYFTAVNIDGKHYVKIPRGIDSWRFDPRIEEKYQYGEEVYAENDLDKGHLVRRMDPNWGEDAQKANDDTFYYTNSAPQHKELNQKIWLELEDYILQNAKSESLRVSVFTGPVFRDDDKVYRRKYKIPAEFWKVAVIVKEDGKLSATAYLQSQKNVVENLEFAYGAYKTYQVPIAVIEQLTGLDFGKLSRFDPIAAIESGGIVIDSPESLRL